MKKYTVKELFYTLQGEGHHAGRPAVFVRFSGCNLWSGREVDRHKAICQFCDTDFVGIDGTYGGKYDAEGLAIAAARLWPESTGQPYIVCTGGEPLLQLDDEMVEAFHASGFEVAIETNGTLPVPGSVDWICVSPKAGAALVQTTGDELKIVYPQEGLDPQEFEKLEFEYFYIQPMDREDQSQNIEASIAFCLQNPQWHLSLQTHKVSGIR